MKSVTAIVLEKELFKQFSKLKPGVVLDVGSKLAPYKDQIPHTKYMTLDINPRVSPDITSDIHKVNWESNYFDTIIATEVVLEHCYSPEKAMTEIHKLLKNGGVCILSTELSLGRIMLSRINFLNLLISKINLKDDFFPLGFIVYAIK